MKVVHTYVHYNVHMCVGRGKGADVKTTFRFSSSEEEYSLNDGKHLVSLIPRPITAGNQRSPTIPYEGGILNNLWGLGTV